MTNREVLIDIIGKQTRRLVLEDGVPVEYAVAMDDQRSLVGSLYLARVQNRLKGMNAAFVDIGLDKNAFLSMDDLPPAVRSAGVSGMLPEQKPLKGGDQVIVQVIKEPGGDKGPRVTMKPTIAGRYVVLLPTMQTIGVSRHIQEEAERDRLLEAAKAVCPDGMGLIVRTAADGEATLEEVRKETEALFAQWMQLAKRAETTQAPALLHGEGGLVEATGRDLNTMPVMGPFPDAIETKLEKALRRKVWLNSGAFLVFDYCEALTVIDVNSGKFTGKKSIAETLLRLNTEAAIAIARQIRLRDLGGIIIIDFVDMREDADRAAVLAAFEEALQNDRAKRHIHGFTGAGLLEMTRRPVYQPIRKVVSVPCACCKEDGAVENPNYTAHAFLRTVRRRRGAGDESEIILRASQAVTAALRNAGIPEGVTISPQEKGETE